jgi:transposase
MAPREELQDAPWALLQPLALQLNLRPEGKRRPGRPDRHVVNGILWLLRTGARSCNLPEPFPPYQTCQQHLQSWAQLGVLREVLGALAHDLETWGKFKLSE